jgi:hypothetical protein
MAWLLAALAAWLAAAAVAAWWWAPPPADAEPPGPDPHAADLAAFARQVADFSRG